MSDKNSKDADSGSFSMQPIIPGRDERIGRSENLSGERRQSSQNAKADTRARKTKTTQPPKQGAMGFWKFLLLVTLLALVGVGYFAWQQSLQLSTLQASFDALQGKLASTDESLSQSGAALSMKLKDQDAELVKHWSEIKKLWGVSNDRNKKSITTNQKNIKSLQSSAVARQKEMQKALSELKTIKKSIDTFTRTSLASKLEIEEAIDQLQDQTDKLNRLDQSIKSWQTNLTARVAENEEAIDAIDAYRLRVNQDLLQMKQRLNQVGTLP